MKTIATAIASFGFLASAFTAQATNITNGTIVDVPLRDTVTLEDQAIPDAIRDEFLCAAHIVYGLYIGETDYEEKRFKRSDVDRYQVEKFREAVIADFADGKVIEFHKGKPEAISMIGHKHATRLGFKIHGDRSQVYLYSRYGGEYDESGGGSLYLSLRIDLEGNRVKDRRTGQHTGSGGLYSEGQRWARAALHGLEAVVMKECFGISVQQLEQHGRISGEPQGIASRLPHEKGVPLDEVGLKL